METKLSIVNGVMKSDLKNTKKHVGVYLRGNLNSIEMQEEVAKKWVTENGYSWGDDIEIFNEGSMSVKSKRPQLIGLREAIKSGKITVLVVFDMVRLYRSFYEYMELVEELIEFKVEVIFVGSANVRFKHNFEGEAIFALLINAERKAMSSRIKAINELKRLEKFEKKI